MNLYCLRYKKKVNSDKNLNILKFLKSILSKTVKATPIKIPAKVATSKFTPAKIVIKNNLLNFLKSVEFRKLFHMLKK